MYKEEFFNVKDNNRTFTIPVWDNRSTLDTAQKENKLQVEDY